MGQRRLKIVEFWYAWHEPDYPFPQDLVGEYEPGVKERSWRTLTVTGIQQRPTAAAPTVASMAATGFTEMATSGASTSLMAPGSGRKVSGTTSKFTT